MNFRIGQSRDIHRLENNSRPLIISGITIESELGPVSHSDGDVVFHCLSEALLGSIANQDLGAHFSDQDPSNKDLNSETILKHCYSLVTKEGYKISNIDINIILEKPKLRDKILLMRENIARILDIELSQVSIKAQTNEKCDSVGQNKAIESNAIVLIEEI